MKVRVYTNEVVWILCFMVGLWYLTAHLFANPFYNIETCDARVAADCTKLRPLTSGDPNFESLLVQNDIINIGAPLHMILVPCDLTSNQILAWTGLSEIATKEKWNVLLLKPKDPFNQIGCWSPERPKELINRGSEPELISHTVSSLLKEAGLTPTQIVAWGFKQSTQALLQWAQCSSAPISTAILVEPRYFAQFEESPTRGFLHPTFMNTVDDALKKMARCKKNPGFSRIAIFNDLESSSTAQREYLKFEKKMQTQDSEVDAKSLEDTNVTIGKASKLTAEDLRDLHIKEMGHLTYIDIKEDRSYFNRSLKKIQKNKKPDLPVLTSVIAELLRGKTLK